MNTKVERRDFIKQTFAAGATLAGARIPGANDRIRIGVIGVGREARGIVKIFVTNPEVQIVALCDVYEPQIDRTIKEIGLGSVERVKDFRRLLDRQDIDAVIVATPDHWHALNTVMACQAG